MIAPGISLVIGGSAQAMSEEEAHLINLTLNASFHDFFSPILEGVARNIEIFYKSPAKIELSSTTKVPAKRLEDATQFDDIIVKILDVHRGQIFFVVMDSALSRTLLTRLVASSLIEETPGLLFSSTEKGIFSFIIARLIVELTKSLGNKMPPLKILGIFHNHEDAIKKCLIGECVSNNFILNFLANRYVLTLFLPVAMGDLIVSQGHNEKSLLARCGHICRDFSLIVYRLKVLHKDVKKMRCGDMIIFDYSTLSFSAKQLEGSMDGCWEQLIFRGSLFLDDTKYYFHYHHQQEKETIPMKALEIVNDDVASDADNPGIRNITDSMRVPMNIEISRIPMTLKEVAQLKPGQIIDTHRKIGDPLEIVIENKVIGYCTPIQIDGRLGIKILDMNDDD